MKILTDILYLICHSCESRNPVSWITLVLVCFLSFSPLPAEEYHVATNGHDSNPGTITAPFRHIRTGVDKLKPGDTCFIHLGRYHETVTVSGSGTSAKNITIKSWPGDTVILDGTEKISGQWTKHKKSIYKLKVKKNYYQIFVNSKMMTLAQWPNRPFNKRWDKSTWAMGHKGTKYGSLIEPKLKEVDIDWKNTMGILNIGSHATYVQPIIEYDKKTTTIFYPKVMGKRLDTQKRKRLDFDRFTLIDRLELLDSPEEWFLDHKNKTLYLWTSTGESPSQYDVRGKTLEYGLIIRDKKHIKVSGLHFFASTFKIEETEFCTLDRCHIEYPNYLRKKTANDDLKSLVPDKWLGKKYDIYFHKDYVLVPTFFSGNNCIFQNSSIRYTDSSAINMAGNDNRIENCLMHDIDLRGLANGLGVALSKATRIKFLHNTIFNIGSSEGVQLPGKGPSEAAYNYVHHAGLVQSDGGLIQCSGIQQRGTQVHHNWVHDHIAFNWGGIGIRGDDLTRGVIFHHNVTWNCKFKSLLTKGDENLILNNTSFSNDLSDIIVPRREEPYKEWNPGQWDHLLKVQNSNTRVINNIADNIDCRFDWEISKNKKKKLNMIMTHAASLKNNYEKEPDFLADMGNYDFRPKYDSPVIDKGLSVPEYTEGFIGDAPDIGAYEFGKLRWVPGYINELWVMKDKTGTPESNNSKLKVRLTMPPLENIVISVFSKETNVKTIPKKLIFTPDDWMKTKTVNIKQNPVRVHFWVRNVNVEYIICISKIDSLEGIKSPFRSIK